MQIQDQVFVDLSLAKNKTSELTATYNSTDVNALWDNTTDGLRSDWTREDTVKPTVLMVLPGGAVDNSQKLTGINTSAKIYFVMNENVSLAGDKKITIHDCGHYTLARRDLDKTTVSGFDNRPLVDPACTADSAQYSFATPALLDNDYGSSVIEVTPEKELEAGHKYYVKVQVDTFKDRNDNKNVEQSIIATPFFTEASRTKPQVERYVYNYDSDSSPVTTLTSGAELLEVWFNMPVNKTDTIAAGDTISAGLTEVGVGGSTADTTLKCSGGFMSRRGLARPCRAPSTTALL